MAADEYAGPPVQEGAQAKTFWRSFIQDPVGMGGTPRRANVPAFEQWLPTASLTDEQTENPEYAYASQFYHLPVNRGDFLSNYGPALASLAMGGAMGMAGGAAGGAEAGLSGMDVMGGLGSADAAALGLEGVTAPGAGAGLSSLAGFQTPFTDPFAAPGVSDLLSLTGGLGESNVSLGFPGVDFINPGMGGTSLSNSTSIWDEVWKKLQGIRTSAAYPIASGLYGMSKANQTSQLAKRAAAQQDPFAPYRAQYGQQLSALMADPSSITGVPGYQAGMQAVNRGMAASGFAGSGNQMAALQQYGGNFYNQETARLAELAGAQFAPSGGNTLLAGQTASNNLMRLAMAGIGYGVGRL